jgi:hypothetical protein
LPILLHCVDPLGRTHAGTAACGTRNRGVPRLGLSRHSAVHP